MCRAREYKVKFTYIYVSIRSRIIYHMNMCTRQNSTYTVIYSRQTRLKKTYVDIINSCTVLVHEIYIYIYILIYFVRPDTLTAVYGVALLIVKPCEFNNPDMTAGFDHHVWSGRVVRATYLVHTGPTTIPHIIGSILYCG